MSATLYDKLWRAHRVAERDEGTALIYIDRHFLHEVTSPQAFEGLRLAGRKPWRLHANLATVDHNIPTTHRTQGINGIVDPTARLQVKTLDDNCRAYGIAEFELKAEEQGIVHMIGPELGATLPGMTIVCGDSHTSTHGAFATLACGIGTSDVEHVLATQCLWQKKMRNMRVCIDGDLPAGVFAKDVILALIRKIGTAGGNGCAIEYTGSTIRKLSMEARMTICNMSIEAGARAGMIAVDDTTVDYLRDRRFAPRDAAWEAAECYWRTLISDVDAVFDHEVSLNVSALKPQVTWGTSPEMVVSIEDTVPDPQQCKNAAQAQEYVHALKYMDLQPGQKITDICLDRVFIGSCTNARMEDLRVAAQAVKGRKVASSIRQALVVPGSGMVKKQAETEGLDAIFRAAGFEWRSPGCSMCLGMNADKLGAGERCASTSNRNFEGRQGAGGRTHLVSPAMAALAAIHGRFVDVRNLDLNK